MSDDHTPTVRPELLAGDQPLSTWHWLTWLWSRPTWGPLTVLLATLLTAWGLTALFFPQSGGQDLYWYLASGQLIAQSGELGGPRQDPFAYSTQPPYDAPRWLNHEWLFTWFIYQVHAIGGLPGLIAFKYLLLLGWGAAITWMGHRLVRDWVLGLLTALVTIPMLGEFCDLRPQLLTYTLTTLLLATWLVPTRRPWLALGCWIVLLVVWANCHSAVILGVALLVGLCGIQALTRALPWTIVLPAVGLVLAAPLLNPFGIEVYLYPLSWVGKNDLALVIQEWRPITSRAQFSTAEATWLIWPAVTLWMLLRDPAGTAARRWHPVFWLLLAVYLMPLQATRHLPLAHMAFAAWWMLAIARQTAWLRLEPVDQEAPRLRAGVRTYAEVAAMLVLLLAIPGSVWTRIPGSLPKRPVEHLHPAYQFPAGAFAFIRQYDLHGPIFNLYDWGGWLTWQLASHPDRDWSIVIDGRLNTVYSPDVIAAYGDLVTAQPAPLDQRTGWDQVGAPARIALLPTLLNGHEVDLTASFRAHPDWALVYEDPVASVFVRRADVASGFIEAAQGLRLAVPEDPMAHFARAMQVLAYGDVAGATREFEACLALDPHHEGAQEQLAVLRSLPGPDTR